MNGHDPHTHAIAMAALGVREAIADEHSFLPDGGAGLEEHRHFVGELREEWPDLWTAIDRLVATTKGYQT